MPNSRMSTDGVLQRPRRSRNTLLATAGAVAALASPAMAVTVVDTFTGTLGGPYLSFNSYDTTGIFGPAGTGLTGDAFKAVVTTNTADATYYSNNGYGSSVQGGSLFGGIASSIITLTVYEPGLAAKSYSWSGSYKSTFGQSAYGATAVVQANSNVNQININDYFGNQATPTPPGSTLPLDFTTAGSYSVSQGSTYFNFLIEELSNGVETNVAEGVLNTTNLTVSGVSAAPEPAAWSLLLAGFGMLGFALRRRAAQAVSTVGA